MGMREMKDSGIEWIGQIPKVWNLVKFSKICNKITDFVASGSFESLRKNVPYLDEPDYALLVRTTDLSGSARSESKVYISESSYIFLKNSNLFGGEIILPNIGASVGDVYEVPVLYKYMSLAPNSIMFSTNYIDKYYYYYFFCDAGRLAVLNIAQSTAQPKFNKTQLRDLRVCVPSLIEQQRIATFLDEKCKDIDNLITLQEEMIAELQAYKQSVISEAVTKGLNPNVPMKDSGVEWIGEIPEQWSVIRLRHLGNLQNGISKGGDYFGEGCPFLNYGDAYQNMFLKEPLSGLAKSNEEDQNTYSVKEGDVFFTRTSETVEEIGFSSACLKTIDKAIFSGFLIRFRPKTSDLNSKFGGYYFRSNIHRRYFVKEMNLVTRASLGQNLLKNLPVILPPLAEQQAIADYLDTKCSQIDELIALKQQKITELQDYKKSLIYEYVTGKKEVPVNH